MLWSQPLMCHANAQHVAMVSCNHVPLAPHLVLLAAHVIATEVTEQYAIATCYRNVLPNEPLQIFCAQSANIQWCLAQCDFLMGADKWHA